nr:DNA/RNA non-specific endonuclease [Acidovorax sp. SRB_24]
MLLAAVGLSVSSCADRLLQEGRELEQLVRELGTPKQNHQRVSRVGSGHQRNASGDFAACRQFFANGRPPVLAPQPTQRALCYDAFAILHSGASKTPVYVAEKLNRAAVADADEVRTNRFFADARLRPAERATLGDYKGSGFDRGHMAPAGNMPTAQAMAQSFSLANIVPQAPQHNQGAWRVSVEAATRKYAAKASGDVYVITGPVFLPSIDESQGIGPGNVRVPRYLFKLVYDEDRNRAWVHWHRNDNATRAAQPISYEELVRRTGIEFLPGVYPRG